MGVPPELQPIYDVFVAYNSFGAKKDATGMDNRTFAKLCRENKLLIAPLLPTDCDLIFASVKPTPNTKEIPFELFLRAIHALVERAKGSLGTTDQCLDLIVTNGGPKSSGTKAEAVKFHDDKSMYTGAHKANHGSDHDTNRTGATEAAMAARKRGEAGQQMSSDVAAAIKPVFLEYCSVGKTRGGVYDVLDSRGFVHMLKDVKVLAAASLTSVDADIIFMSSVIPGEKVMAFKSLSGALHRLAGRSKGVYKHPDDVANVIVAHYKENGGVQINGTKAEFTKWHDDKSTYTGAHGAVHEVTKEKKVREKASDIDLAALAAPGGGAKKGAKALWKKGGMAAMFMGKMATASREEIPTSMLALKPMFEAYARVSAKTDDTSCLDGRSFAKFTRDMGLLVPPLQNNDCDLVFAEIKSSPFQKKISFKEFLKAVGRLMVRADGKLGDLAAVIEKCEISFEANGGKPLNNGGTVAEANKFHDDKSLYTGVYKNGGPTNVGSD